MALKAIEGEVFEMAKSISEEIKALLDLGYSKEQAAQIATAKSKPIKASKEEKAKVREEKLASIKAESDKFAESVKMQLVQGVKYVTAKGNKLPIHKGMTDKGVVFYAENVDDGILLWKGRRYFRLGYSLQGHPNVQKC